MANSIEVLEQVQDEPIDGGWILCFQKCIYHLDDSDKPGFRFIWRRPNGTLQAARGQARIPDVVTLERLLAKAKNAKWYG